MRQPFISVAMKANFRGKAENRVEDRVKGRISVLSVRYFLQEYFRARSEIALERTWHVLNSRWTSNANTCVQECNVCRSIALREPRQLLDLMVPQLRFDSSSSDSKLDVRINPREDSYFESAFFRNGISRGSKGQGWFPARCNLRSNNFSVQRTVYGEF